MRGARGRDNLPAPFSQRGYMIADRDQACCFTHTIEPPHPVIEKLEMFFQLFRLDDLAERPSRKWPARMRYLQYSEPNALPPFRGQNSDSALEILVAETAVGCRDDVLAGAADNDLVSEVLLHRLVV